MTELAPTTVLQRAPEISVRLHSDNIVEITLGDGEAVCPGNSRALAILDAFSHPTSFADALDHLHGQIQGAQDWIDVTNTIVEFFELGILRDEDTSRLLGNGKSSYGAPGVHVAMLDDRSRTTSFLRAIEEVVRVGDVVVDIGTGTGVLAVAAARAGASRVYAIEASTVSDAAAAVVEANGVSDRITVIDGWSTQVELPERGDVLVSEVIGHEPLAEQVLEVTLDARTRLLKPGARLIPSRLQIYAFPVSIPASELAKRTFTPESVDKWRSWYGIDFSPLVDFGERSRFFSVRLREARDWPTLTDPVLLVDVGLDEGEGVRIDTTAFAVATASGQVNGVLIYFELQLGPTTRLSTHPRHATDSNHWRAPVWRLADPLAVRTGERLSLTYTYRVAGKETGVSVSRA